METTLNRTQRGQARSHTTLVVGIVGSLFLVSACAFPVTVKRADPEAVQRELTGYVLTTGELSLASENTLRRYALTERFEDAPENALAELHAAAIRDDNPNAIFALSELSFYHAKESDERSYYLAAAVYAFAFLFPDGAGAPPNPIDPRLRAACDLYSRGLTEGFLSDNGKEVEVQGGGISTALRLTHYHIQRSAIAVGRQPEPQRFHLRRRSGDHWPQ